MQTDTTAPPAPISCRSGVVTLDGYAISATVRHGQLQLSDGLGRNRRQTTYGKPTCGIRRLVVVGHTGAITLDASRWLAHIGAAFVQIDRDGELLFASGALGRDDSRLRRAQALAPYHPEGVELARYLLSEKLAGQLAVARRIDGSEAACELIEQALTLTQETDDLRVLLQAESHGAGAYWSAWAALPLRFGKRDVVAPHWLTFGQRTSPLTGSPRLAGNPANALLNYLYAILEAEARIACLAVGLDPGLGFFHADQPARDSLACDLMEAVRPQVDAFVLDLLSSRTFRARDFFETAPFVRAGRR